MKSKWNLNYLIKPGALLEETNREGKILSLHLVTSLPSKNEDFETFEMITIFSSYNSNPVKNVWTLRGANSVWNTGCLRIH